MSLPTVWFLLLGFALTAYVVLDGYDLGAAIVMPFVARGERERALVVRSITPVWDGNEVWLLAAGGTTVLAFPRLYATAFSGFYLPLTLVLWLLIGRALAIELRHQLHHPVWTLFWDRILLVSSALVVVCFGAALGNVVRGVPMDEESRFFLPLWGDAERPGVLDGFTLSVAVAALAGVALHGAMWIAHRTDGVVQGRARRVARIAAFAAAATTALVTFLAWRVQPHIPARLAEQPWIYAAPALAVAGLAGALVANARGADLAGLGASAAHLVGMLASAALGLYPYLLPATGEASRSLTVENASSGGPSQSIGLLWWIPGIALAIGWQALVHWRFRGKVSLESDTV